MSKPTPMMQQYNAIKAKYPDCILFFRLGDFYEMFGEDAQLAAGILEITLTARDAGKGERMPMCGVPHHAVEAYLPILVEQGYKVAICEQLEDPKIAKGVVHRDVIRIVTPGTIMESGVLKEKQNHFLAALHRDGRSVGLAYVDLSTGEFAVTEFEGGRAGKAAADEVERLRPVELLVAGEDGRPAQQWLTELKDRVFQHLNIVVSTFDPRSFRHDTAYRRLTEHFGTASLSGFGCEDLKGGVCAAGGIITYLIETQKTSLTHISRLSPYWTTETMIVDGITRRNLELTATLRQGKRKGSLLSVVDKTATAMGGRLLRQWLERPLARKAEIDMRLDAVETLKKNYLFRRELRETLRRVYDMERLVSRVAYSNANARDLQSLRQSLGELPHIRDMLHQHDVKGRMATLSTEMDVLTDIADLISGALVDEPPVSVREGGLIRSGYDGELDRLRSASKEGKDWIASLEYTERENTGIKSLKVGFNKVFGYYIEVTKANLHLVPDSYQRKQTLANAERFITPELKEKESLVLGAEEKIIELEYRLFLNVRAQVSESAARIQETARLVAELDVYGCLAEVAHEQRYVRPTVTDEDTIHIKDGRHPVVEVMLDDELFVPNDVDLDDREQQLIILTGPNMAGKSTYLRMTALIVLLAHMGSFVPAREARIGLVDRIFTRVGASDDLATGQSTFMVEMNEVANILNNATPRSLVLLDEIGRGTSTFDGMSIAWSVMEYLHDLDERGVKTLFATHYHEITELETRLARVANFSVAVKEEGQEIVFLRRIVPGGADQSYGIEVARLAGVPKPVLRRAAEILVGLEQTAAAQEASGISEVKRTRQYRQMVLFDGAGTSPELQEVVEALKRIDVMTMTPLEALNRLNELQKQAEKAVRALRLSG